MLEHSTSIRRVPSRVVVIGAGGFVGSAICARLAADKVPVLAHLRFGPGSSRCRIEDWRDANALRLGEAWEWPTPR